MRSTQKQVILCAYSPPCMSTHCSSADLATVVGYLVVSRPFLNLSHPRHLYSSHSELLEVRECMHACTNTHTNTNKNPIYTWYENAVCIQIRSLYNKQSDLALVFTPGIFNAILLSLLRLDFCPPEQNLHMSNLRWWQISPRCSTLKTSEFCELLS